MRTSSKIMGAAILVAAAFAAVVWTAAIRLDHRGLLTVSFLNVGQGDAIFIEAPSGRQVLIDGGPDGSVLRELGAVMPWYDRSIDVVIPTHPDKDHISGLVDVLKRYAVDAVLRSSVQGTTDEWRALERELAQKQQEGLNVVTAQRGQLLDLGTGVYLEVLMPDRRVQAVDTNTGCVVMRLVYGDTAFMLTCDMPQDVEKYLAYLDGGNLRSDVLKAGHHGSRTSSSPLFVGLVRPTYVVYSRGCNNTYGFPHPETAATMAAFGVAALDTCTQGRITFISDGKTVVLQK